MNYSTTSAIVLRSVAIKDHQRILTLFSMQFGMISAIIKGLSSKKSFKLPLCEPFCEVDLVISRKHKDLFTLHEGFVKDLHLPLREELRSLATASSMARALLHSQLPEKPAPLLYSLFASCLKQIPSFSCHNTLLSCFYLKLLKHEGIFSPHLLEIDDIEKKHFSNIIQLQNFSSLKKLTTTEKEFHNLERLFLERIQG